MNLAVILGSFRLNFLILTPVCIFMGAAVVIHQGEPVPLLPLILALTGGLLAHISVNALNEYLDFTSGLDLATQRTPFSGGSGTLPAHPELKNGVLAAGLVTLLLTALVGLYFVLEYGPALLPLGIAGLLVIALYTRTINRVPWLCLIAPGLGFGILMVVGTQFVLTGNYSPESILIGFVPFFLVNNLLLLNQYPDVEADRNAGRNHLPVAYGVSTANRVYGLQWAAAGVVIIALVLNQTLPLYSLLALVGLIPGFVSWRGAVKLGFNIASEPKLLAMNVITALLTPALVALTLVF